MKRITAIIREERLQHARKALAEKNVYGIMVLSVKGHGSNGCAHLNSVMGYSILASSRVLPLR